MSSREWNIQPGHLSQWLRVFRSCLLTWSLKTSLGFFWKPLHLVLFISMEVRDCDFSFASVEAYLLSKAALYVQRHKVWSQCCSRSGRARGVTVLLKGRGKITCLSPALFCCSGCSFANENRMAFCMQLWTFKGK